MNTRLPTQVKTISAPSFTPVQISLLQRQCACGQHTVSGGDCAECRQKRLNFQRRSTTQAKPANVPAIVHDVLRSPGRPLDPATRAFMEPRFGRDFSQVRAYIEIMRDS